MPLVDGPDDAQEQDEPQDVADADARPSDDAEETEASFFDKLIRLGRSAQRRVGELFEDGDGSSDADGEDAAEGDTTTEKADQAQATTALTEDELERRVQAETDRREAKRQREREQAEKNQRTAEEWERLRALAKEGDVVALGEIARKEVEDREAKEEEDRRYADFFNRSAPGWDATYLDPLLSALPEAVWKPIVGDGLTTMTQRTDAVARAIAAHRAAAVTEALKDADFVRDLLRSDAFREGLRTSDAVKKQLLALTRADDDYDEADAPPGVGRGLISGDESADMDALIRGQAQRAVSTRSQRRRERGNRDLIER